MGATMICDEERIDTVDAESDFIDSIIAVCPKMPTTILTKTR